METTREQDHAAEFVSAAYGRAAVEPSVLHYATRSVVIIGLTDDVERSRWTVKPDGAVVNVTWHDPQLAAYLIWRVTHGYGGQRQPRRASVQRREARAE